MPAGQGKRHGVLYLIVCGAPPARDSGRLVQLAQAEGWEVCVIATPSALSFIDAPALEAATGHPVAGPRPGISTTKRHVSGCPETSRIAPASAKSKRWISL